MRVFRIWFVRLLLGLLSWVTVHNAMASSVEQTERQLLSGLAALQNLQLDQAIQQFDDMTQAKPNYRLAQMLKADLLAIKSGQKLNRQTFRKHYPKTIAALQKEALVRWQFSQGFDLPDIQRFILKKAEAQFDPVYQPYALFVDLESRRVHVFEYQNQSWGQVADFYGSIGGKGTGKLREGDRRTPIGVYLIADLIDRSQLPDFYGPGALPLNYPNSWDAYQGRTGSGIWLHGVPSETYARNPDASRGCVVLTNDAMNRLLNEFKLPLATPVILWDRRRLLSNPTLPAGSFTLPLASLKKVFVDRFPKVPWNGVNVYRYPNEENLLYLTFPKRINSKTSKNSEVLTHQFWRWKPHLGNGSGFNWQLLHQADMPIEIQYFNSP